MQGKTTRALLITFILVLSSYFASSLFGFNQSETRVFALLIFAASFWILEPIPIYATSMLLMLLELLFVSNQSIRFFAIQDASPQLNYLEIFGTLSSPIIILFLGGFFLAIAATKYRLDQNLARILLRPWGQNPRQIMLGLMLITAVFSMFMSNTATTAMMLSILAPVLLLFDKEDPGKIGFALAIPIAANIGGIGTPIGTPPNAIALKYLEGIDAISFGQWMAFAVPFVLVLLLLAWLLLCFLYPAQKKTVNINITGSFLLNRKAVIVYCTFILTILLWLTDFFHGINSYVVAMIPVATFLSTGIINKEDLKKISWDVLWLVSGGIALGLAMDKTGLAKTMINSIPFDDFGAIYVLVGISLIAALMANFMSNTATANLLIPVVAALGASVPNLIDLGGAKLLILSTTMACSMGMALPISTPPNALVFGTGLVTTRDMSKPGLIIAFCGLLGSFVLLIVLSQLNFFE